MFVSLNCIYQNKQLGTSFANMNCQHLEKNLTEYFTDNLKLKKLIFNDLFN